MSRIQVLLGGRIAEELVLEEISTGAGHDLEVSTDLARKMVTNWGMSDKLGPLTFGKRDEMVFLGKEMSQHKDYSEKTAESIDVEVKRIIDDNYKRAERVLDDRRDVLERLAETLLEHESLDGKQIDAVIEGKPLPQPEKKGKDKAEEKKEKEPRRAFRPTPALPQLKEDPEEA